jgi:hypothetical protein
MYHDCRAKRESLAGEEDPFAMRQKSEVRCKPVVSLRLVAPN